MTVDPERRVCSRCGEPGSEYLPETPGRPPGAPSADFEALTAGVTKEATRGDLSTTVHGKQQRGPNYAARVFLRGEGPSIMRSYRMEA